LALVLLTAGPSGCTQLLDRVRSDVVTTVGPGGNCRPA